MAYDVINPTATELPQGVFSIGGAASSVPGVNTLNYRTPTDLKVPPPKAYPVAPNLPTVLIRGYDSGNSASTVGS